MYNTFNNMMLEVYHFVTPLRFRVQDSRKLAQEGGRIHTLWLKFCFLQEVHSIFNYSLKIIFERKGGLVNSLVLGCTQSGFPQKLKNNLKFLSLSVAMN